MKLATLADGSRDGCLVVVDKSLQRAVRVESIAKTLQQALDNWSWSQPQLAEVYSALQSDDCQDSEPFDVSKALAPLPRAYHWADGSAYVNHVELVRKARGAAMPENFWTDPLIYQGGSDKFIAPQQDIVAVDEAHGIDFEAEIAVITDDVPMAVSEQQAGEHIQLLMLVNDVSLRNLIPNELGKGFGFYQSKPATSFSPVAVTPDELGDAWLDNKVCLPLHSYLNGELFGQPDAGTDMTFSFARLIAHAAATRELISGSIIGSGTVSNTDRSRGSSCIAEKRMLELLATGEAQTSFLRFGDRVRIELFDADGQSIFGAIDQQVVALS